uniref:Stum, mechanosensory transduction mediator homolog n=1 Tax=Buteo japonicus TaxID=224669 RepID=A0A8C0B635_9AVES
SEFFVSWSQAEPRAATPVGLREGIWHEAVAFTGCFVAALSLGTFVSAFTVLCGARTDLPDRHMCCVFWLNIAAALIQILTAIVMVGWIMSIFWGMDMVILASWQGRQFPKQALLPENILPAALALWFERAPLCHLC